MALCQRNTDEDDDEDEADKEDNRCMVAHSSSYDDDKEVDKVDNDHRKIPNDLDDPERMHDEKKVKGLNRTDGQLSPCVLLV